MLEGEADEGKGEQGEGVYKVSQDYMHGQAANKKIPILLFGCLFGNTFRAPLLCVMLTMRSRSALEEAQGSKLHLLTCVQASGGYKECGYPFSA